ncbi:uncharacterized protein LOC143462765 isoform X1 [Clavelina lepadiformis]|uniref:uncharacterized protein LOC143462765 isoform X1 n=1 Tax=Clavelina lepadiformis TaxID=159417 RepID=UPI0040415C12
MNISASLLVSFGLFICLSESKSRRQRSNFLGRSSSATSGGKKYCPEGCDCIYPTNLVTYHCEDLKWEKVPENLSYLTSRLYLSQNELTCLGARDFSNLQLIRTLGLSHNEISEIDNRTFIGMHKLEDLSLSANKLEHIPEDLFAGTHNLRRLKLDANSLRDLPEGSLHGLRNLEELRLDDNLLTRIPMQALRHTQKLRVLKLDVNRIASIADDAFASLHKLRVLTLRENRITRIGSRGFEGLNNLKALDVSTNQLTRFPRAVTALHELEDLYLNDNTLRSIPDHAFNGQRNLKNLEFSNNPLMTVGKSSFTNLSFITSLTIINVIDQEDFPDLTGCHNLKEFSITGGRISSLPPNICEVNSSLQRLDVSGNLLRNLSGLSNCRNLTFLDASTNAITSLLREELKNLTMLDELNLSNNDIGRLDDNVFDKMSFDKLNLGENPFSFLPVFGLRHVRSLNVSAVPNLLFFPPISLLRGLRFLRTTYAYHCCAVSAEKPAHGDESSSGVSCFPEPGPLTPCNDLLPSVVVRVVLYVVIIISTVLNVAIIFAKLIRKSVVSWKRTKRQKRSLPASPGSGKDVTRKNGQTSSSSSSCSNEKGAFDLMLCHLAFSDIIVSVYVVIILNYDAQTSGRFGESGAFWQQSRPCKAAGFFFVMGTQLSFFTVLIAAVERYLSTMYPLARDRHIGKAAMSMSLIAAWLIAMATAVVTLFSGTTGLVQEPNDLLPPYNGATCLPWSTDFPYVAILVGTHLIACMVVIVLCVLMFCARRKQSWLSTQKHTRRQVALTVACNVSFTLPLALIGLLTSAIATYPSATDPWLSSGSSSSSHWPEEETPELNVKLMLAFVMLFISLRLIINPLLYIVFSPSFRKGSILLTKKLFCFKPRRHGYPSEEMEEDEERATSDIADDDVSFQDRDRDYHLQRFVLGRQINEEGIGVMQEEPLEEFLPHPAKGVYGAMLCNGSYPVVQVHAPSYLHHDITPTSQWNNRKGFVTCQVDQSDDDDVYYDVNPHLYQVRPMYFKSVGENSSHLDADLAGPSRRDTSTSFLPQKKRRKLQEARNNLPPLVLQQNRGADASREEYNVIKLLQSCESSTSKDSGIQSEPDFSSGAVCSSSSLSGWNLCHQVLNENLSAFRFQRPGQFTSGPAQSDVLGRVHFNKAPGNLCAPYRHHTVKGPPPGNGGKPGTHHVGLHKEL